MIDLHTLFSTFTDGDLFVGKANSTVTDGNLSVANVNLAVEVSNPVMVDESKDSCTEPAYHNPHYLELQNLIKENPLHNYEEVNVDRSDVDTAARDYQSLNTITMDYVSMYSVPDKGREGEVIPKIEVGGKLYAVVNKNKTEQHIYSPLAK